MNDIRYQDLTSGKYEAQRLPVDLSPESPVPDYAFNVLTPRGLLYRPVVDEHLLAQGMEKPKWPEAKPFAACLTHDVDAVSTFSLAPALRKRYIRYSTSSSLSERIISLAGFGVDLFRTVQHRKKHDPLFCMERWLEMETRVNSHSTFFFWPGLDAVGKRHVSDCAYKLSDRIIFDGQSCTVAESIREISRRGWEIGLHASWYSYADVDELQRQKDALEKVTAQEIISVRQHYLHYDIRLTPRVHSNAGFKYDSTLGFNDNIGFRFGTCRPWQLCDPETEETLPIMEVPMIIQDTAMLDKHKGMRLDEETAFQYIQRLSRVVETVGGVLTLSWHPEYINCLPWKRLYVRTIEYLKERNACFGSVKEIMNFMKNAT